MTPLPNPATKPHVILISGKSGHGSQEIAAELARLFELKNKSVVLLHFLLDFEHGSILEPRVMTSLMDSIAKASRYPLDYIVVADVLTEAEFSHFPKALRVRVECADAETRRIHNFVEHRRETPDELEKHVSANLFDMVFSTEKEKPVEIARAIVLKLAQGKGPK